MKVEVLAELQHDLAICVGPITLDSTNPRENILENEKSHKHWIYINIKTPLFALFSEQYGIAIYKALTPF